MTKKERQLIFDKYKGHCAYCGCELEKGWHVDHKEPLVRDILTLKEKYPERKHIDNLMPSCASCNINKHSMSLEEFRKLIKGFMKHLNEVNTQYKIAKRYKLVFETDIDIKFYFERLDVMNNITFIMPIGPITNPDGSLRQLKRSYDEDYDKYLKQLCCTDCDNNEVDKELIYMCTYANGELWHCKKCGKDNILDEKPNTENY